MNRTLGVLSQFGVARAFTRLRKPEGNEVLVEHGVPAVWRHSIAEAVAVITILDSGSSRSSKNSGRSREQTRACSCSSRSRVSASCSG